MHGAGPVGRVGPAIMHGSWYVGNGTQRLNSLADDVLTWNKI